MTEPELIWRLTFIAIRSETLPDALSAELLDYMGVKALFHAQTWDEAWEAMQHYWLTGE